MSTAIRSRPRSIATGIATLAAIIASALVVVSQPDVQAATCPALPSPLPAAGSLPAVNELPDPFRYFDGTRLTNPADWSCRRAQLSELLQTYQYGHLPAPPTSVTGTRNGNTLTVTVQANGRTASFNATLALPAGTGPFPAIIMLNPLAASATSRGYAEVRIDPNSIAADSTSRTGAFWTLYSAAGVDTGVLMAWAWGVHRTLDALTAVPQIDRTRVGVSGYSRYGKAALVAGAFDERIAATFPGSSGTAGMGDYRFFFTGGTNDETPVDITNAFPFWFTSRFTTFRGQVPRLPFDQHSLAAMVAPRLLLATNGTQGTDIRTNPQGAGLAFRGAQMVYQYLGVRDRVGIAYRSGGHQIDINDYNAIMDFSDKYLRGLPVSRTFENVPYPAPTAAQIPWTIPPVTPTSPPPTSASPTASPTGSPTASPTSSPTSSPTFSPTSSPQPPGGCRVAYTISTWGTGSNGFTAGLALTNTGSAPLTWTLRFVLPAGQALTPPGWAATWSPSGQTITATGLAWNATLPPGQSTQIGFNGTHTGNTAEPTAFTVNNSACTVV